MTPLHGDQNNSDSNGVVGILDKTLNRLGDRPSARRRNHLPSPGRRRLLAGGPGFAFTPWLLWSLLIFAMVSGSVEAGDRRGRRSAFGRLNRQEEEILVDHGPAPRVPKEILQRRQEDLFDLGTSTSLQRQSFAATASAVDRTATSLASVVSPSDESSATTTTSSEPTSTATATPTAPTGTYSLPKPFDGGLGTNYTQESCPNFLRTMLRNETFSKCLPLSVLLQVSEDDAGIKCGF